MLTIKQFMTASGLEIPHDRIKLVRHVNHPLRTLAEMIDAGEFEFYQSEQKAGTRPFDDCDVILSFLISNGRLSAPFPASCPCAMSSSLSNSKKKSTAVEPWG